MEKKKKGNVIALLPIFVFVALYLGIGVTFEYVLKMDMGFYNVPIVVMFMAALFVAMVQNRKLTFDDKLEIMGRGVADKDIIVMVLIFITAGIFVGVVGRGSAQSVAYCLLSILPVKYAVPVLFLIACIVSIAMGTSVGTITLIVPIGIYVAKTADYSVPLCLAAIMGGSMFGDNLSVISDTTIAACKGQGCEMRDKFRTNIGIALPAAILCVIIFYARSQGAAREELVIPEYNLLEILPYVIVLIGGVIGINVLLVLIMGIVSGTVIMLVTGAASGTELIIGMGNGVGGMLETVVIAVLVAAICALIRENGGFDVLLDGMNKVFKGYRGGQIGIASLVALLDIATANNTVAIVMANPIAREVSEKYGISHRKTASLLDTFSCVTQGMIPYGAQMLVTLSAATSLHVDVSAFDIIPMLYYQYILLIMSILFIFFKKGEEKKNNGRSESDRLCYAMVYNDFNKQTEF